MKYALLIYADEKAWASVPHDEQHAIYEEYDKFANELVERGVMRGGDELADSPAATTVRVRDGEQLVTDGPFAETKEQLGGYYIVEVGDLDRRSSSPAGSRAARTAPSRSAPSSAGMTDAPGSSTGSSAARRAGRWRP